VEKALAEFASPQEWDLSVLRDELMLHYMLSVPRFNGGDIPTTIADARSEAVQAAKQGFTEKMVSLNEYAGQLLSLVMLNVLDEKWKDHLYDLDQLRNAIHYRSWGQRDPLVEYKQEAYTMFVDLMEDIQHTFTERFSRAQIVFEQPSETLYAAPPEPTPQKATKRYNALGILEDISDVATVSVDEVMDIGPAETPAEAPVATRPEPTVVGLGRTRSLSPSAAGAASANVDRSAVGRNDPCPCGSGKKFKKCHGAQVS
jgi:preprotein translocase subunit SecA